MPGTVTKKPRSVRVHMAGDIIVDPESVQDLKNLKKVSRTDRLL